MLPLKVAVLALALAALVAAAPAQTVLVKPYLQPGDPPADTDVKVLTWVTDQKPGTFVVEYGWRGIPAVKSATPLRTTMDFAKARVKPKTSSSKPAATDETKPANPLDNAATTLDELDKSIVETFKPLQEREQHFYRYRAVLTGLPLDTEVGYRVRLGSAVVREGKFKSRASATKPIRFVAVGDMASNKPEQFGIAYQISLQHPEFLVALGDIVYPGGRVLQYMNHFFPCYNDVAAADPKKGAPLLASIPIYPVIGNHDADMQKFPDYPDAYSAFYWFSVPKKGPGVGAWNLSFKDEKLTAAFKAIAGPEYPAMSDYSFDYGPAHFIVIDANSYAIKQIENLIPWIERDLAATKQPWKFVCFHQPAFHTSKEHYTQQGMRLLEPAFEKGGVDVVFAGHVHNYQRSKPLKFTPNPPKRDARGRVNGDLVLDQTYDGTTDTTPEGIIHIVSGGGGASLYKITLEKTIEGLKKDHGANYTPLTEKYDSSTHSFSVIDLTPTTFELRQISIEGKEIDRFRIAK
jgi:acid phosphatase type 7